MSLCYSPDGKSVAFIVGRAAYVHDLPGGELHAAVECEYWARSVRFVEADKALGY